MRRLFEQVYQVLIVYVMRPRSRLEIGFITLMVPLSLWGAETSGSPFTFIYGIFVAILLNQHMTTQFAHYRSKLTPGFRLPHLLPPIILCIVLILLIPAFVAAVDCQPVWKWLALSSSWFAVFLLGSFYQAFSWIIMAVFIGPMLFGHSITDLRIDLPSPACAAIAIGAWALIALHLSWLTKLHEDEPASKRAVEKALGSTQSGSTYRASRPQHSPGNTVSRWPKATDWWHDRIGGFHGFRPIRIIRLLRYGMGPTPTELRAILFGMGAILLLLFMAHPFSGDQESSNWTSLWLMVALYATLLPSAQAGVELGERRPFLAAELMRPLSRRQLINGLLLADAWNATICWLLSNATLLIALSLLPGKPITLMFAATYLLLSAAMATLMFGLALFDIRFVSAVERIIALLFVLAISIGVLVWWWLARRTTGDIPFWIAAFLLFAFGKALIDSARNYWLNLELANTDVRIYQL